MYKIIAPYSITLERKTKPGKKIAINLNTYRNLSHFTNNDIKKKYLDIVSGQISQLPHFDTIYVIYKAYYATNGRHDKGNVLSVSQKFFLDALVETETIDDDSDGIVECEMFMTGETDRNNPRVEIMLFDDKKEYKEYIKKHL